MTKESKQQAQYLLTRYVEGNISEKEETMLFQLLRVETDSEEWQEMIEELMAAEPELATYRKEEWQSLVNEILSNRVNDQKTAPGVITLLHNWRWIAAAAILILFVGAYWFYQHKPEEQVIAPVVAKTKDVEPPKTNKATITLADGRIVDLETAGIGTLANQANITVEKTADGKISYQPTNSIAGQILYNILTNPRGSKVIDMQFADGSHVWLNAGSSVRYPVAFIGKERRVEVTGEAYFEVTHDAGHPFIVSKGDLSVRVLGTHFNVNAYDDEDAIRVTLLQGSVKVGNSAGSIVIEPGQQAAAMANGKPRPISSINVDEVMAWKNGLFSFKNSNLQTVMKELARWYDIEVIYERAAPYMQFSGELERSLSLSQVLQVLEKSGVHFTIENRTIKVNPNK